MPDAASCAWAPSQFHDKLQKAGCSFCGELRRLFLKIDKMHTHISTSPAKTITVEECSVYFSFIPSLSLHLVGGALALDGDSGGLLRRKDGGSAAHGSVGKVRAVVAGRNGRLHGLENTARAATSQIR